MMKNVNVIKAWREASTLLVLAKQNRSLMSQRFDDIIYNTNYDILLQTRASSASTFPNSVVFPGGVSESADTSEKWLDLIRSHGYTQRHFQSLHCEGAAITPLFQDNPIQRHIDLRITAIRETFEETGLLICSRNHCDSRSGPWADHIADIDLTYWRNKVSENPEELYKLCEQNNCYPDIWKLHFWSNWLTPTHLTKRFDTAFFVVALEDRPGNISGNSETAKVEWCTVEDILERHRRSDVQLITPQIYELLRLSHFSSVTDLVTFAHQRQKCGDELLYPVIIRVKEGSVFLLPGDDQYPTNVDFNREPIDATNKTITELRKGVHILHRVEFSKGVAKLVIENYKSANHVTP